MAEKDLYLKEAYEELERLSMGRGKAVRLRGPGKRRLRDHISMMNYAMEKGLQEGRDKGYAEGREAVWRVLLREERYEDMNRAIQDKEVRKKLIEEYQL